MKRSTFKIEAREILDLNGASARLVAFFVPSAKLLITVPIVFALLSLKRAGLLASDGNMLYTYLYYAVIIAVIFIVINILAYLDFLKDRWFILNRGDLRFRDLFVGVSLKQQFKCFVLFALRFLYSAVIFVFFEAPALITGFLLYRSLSSSEMKLSVAAVSALLFFVLLFSGAFFAFSEAQRFSFVGYILAVFPEIKIKNAVKMSGEAVRDKKFFLAFFKVSFLPWFLLCLMLLPLLFVLPYYLQSVAQTVKPSLKASGPARENYNKILGKV